MSPYEHSPILDEPLLEDKGATPIASRNGRTGWLAQLMVLLNGTIITLTAFITLNLFINDIQANKLRNESSRIESTLKDKMDLLQRDMDLLKTIVPYAPSENINTILQSKQLSGLSQASIIAWKDASEGALPRILYDKNEINNNAWKIFPTLASMTSQPNEQGFSTFFINDPNTHQPLAFFIGTLTDDVTHKIKGNLIVILQGRNIIKWSEFIRMSPNLHGLKILDIQNGSSLANYGVINPSLETRSFPVHFGGYEWNVTAQFDQGDEYKILGYVPVLMLFFGMTLTLIGSLYVRNNQATTVKLQKMNDLLRDKNQDIRTQMERTSQLYTSLRASERDYSAVINAVNDVIFETDKTGRIVFLNDAWQRLTGREAADSLGKYIFDFIHEQDKNEPLDAMDQVFNNRLTNFRTLTRIRVDGTKYRFVELTFSLIRMDEAGNKRLVGMMTDIEERRQAEIALREAERRYRNIVENAVSGLFQVSIDGRFISANPALAKLLGYDSPNDMLRDPLFNKNYLYADEKEKDLLLRLVKRQGQVRMFEARYKRADGEIFWGSENLRAVMNDNDEIIYYEGAIDDITKRKEAEISMQQARLESDLANRAKTEFLANMSHELRTPLNAIIGFSDIIHQESLGPIGVASYLDYANEINAGGKQLLKIINEILEVSKIELSEKPTHESTIDLRKICDTCVSLVRGKGEDKMIVIETHLAPQLPIIIGSETGFKQMILNLLHNALSHTSQGGHISIESILDQDHSVRISVSDNGAGMDPEDIRRALQPLNEPHSGIIHDMDNEQNQKTFGLSLVRSLIAQHDGRLEIISHKGIGTTATLIIPPNRIIGILDKNNANTGTKLSS